MYDRKRHTTVIDAQRAIRDTGLTSDELRDLASAMTATRKRAGMTQRQVAEAMGIDQGSVARLESGRHKPSIRVLQRFARVTGTRLRVLFEPVPPFPLPEKARTMMTMSTVSNRRHFLGGTAGLAGLLGLGNIKYVTAEEATAAAETIDSYVWTPPAYDPEPALFTVLDRNDQIVTVETIDGQIEIPAKPQRVVSLGWEYIPLFELGITDPLIAVGYDDAADHLFESAGNLTGEMRSALANVTLISNPWELDMEQIVALSPDLILSNPWWIEDPETLRQIAPLIRGTVGVADVPRAAVRDFGLLFDSANTATQLIAEHESFIERARQVIAPMVEGKKALALFPAGENFYALPSFYIENDGIFANVIGPYPIHRELGITPSSLIEQLADNDDRQSREISLSMEQIGEVDADYIFAYSSAGEYDNFARNPLVQHTAAGQNNQVHAYDSMGFGYGLAGVRAAVAWIVETLTGEPFE